VTADREGRANGLAVEHRQCGLEARAHDVGRDPWAGHLGILLEAGGIESDDGLRVVAARQPQLEARHLGGGAQVAGLQAHQALAQGVPARAPRSPGGHAQAPRHASLGVEGPRARQVRVGAAHIGVVPRRHRQPRGHQADVAQVQGPAAGRLAQAALDLPGVGARCPDPVGDHLAMMAEH
jgi:hypothetical protein